MNRRDLIRTGLGGIVAGQLARPVWANDQAGAATWAPAPTEEPPLQGLDEPLVSLVEAAEKNLVQVTWVVTQPHRARLTLKNKTGRRLALTLAPGTTLVHEKQAWLVGGPTRYVGQFGGQLQARDFAAEVQPAFMPIAPGRTAVVALPLVCLYGPTSEKFAEIKSVKLMPASEFSKDSKVVAGLVSLGALGSSMTTAQAIAWRMVAGLAWDKLANQTVEGQAINQFERLAVERFLEVQGTLSTDQPISQLRAQLLKDRLTVLVTGFGPKRAPGVKLLEGELANQLFMGMMIDHLQGSPASFPKASVIRLEFHVADQVRKGLFAVDASLASRTGPSGLWLKFAKTRIAMRQDDDISTMLDELEQQFSPSIIALTRTSQGPMTSRFRLENQSPLTVSAVETMTNADSADPALYSLIDLGVAPRGRAIVKVPSATARAARVRFSVI
jgi:hypothetical protein